MPDPRTNLFSVKPCPPEYLGKSQALIGGMASDRRNFFGALGKIGDTRVLSKFGGGKVAEGLRTLASISNTIRGGSGSLPTSIGSAAGAGLDAGTRWVLGTVGIAPTLVTAMQDYHPEIANQALGQAESVFQRVKQGNFKLTDVPASLQDLQNLERLGRNIFTPSDVEGKKLREVCEASPYAIDMIARAPKYKFLFVVEFVFNQGYDQLQRLSFPFVIKNTTRPKVRYQMEDVNYYNFRTKVITKTEFEEMSMSFHDDTQNYGMAFYNAYMRAYTPITNIPNAEGLTGAESNGMDFASRLTDTNMIDGNIPSNYYTGSFGPLVNNRKTVLTEIRLMHLYDFGRLMNVYTFFNPRISGLTLDDLDMSIGNQGSEFACTFNYDSVFISEAYPVGAGKFSVEQQKANPVYPLRNTDGATGTGGSNMAGFPVVGNPAGVFDSASKAINTIIAPPSNIPFITGGGLAGGVGGVLNSIG